MAKEFPERMFVFAMDVTSDEDANKAAEFIKANLPAGTGRPGPLWLFSCQLNEILEILKG